MIGTMNGSEKVAAKRCHACGSGLLESSRFCRRCGVNQVGPMAERNVGDERPTLPRLAEQRYETAGLAGGDMYHRVSGPLVSVVTAGLAATTTTRLKNLVLRALVLILLSVPLWLIIILLSPFDAIAAADQVRSKSQ